MEVFGTLFPRKTYFVRRGRKKGIEDEILSHQLKKKYESSKKSLPLSPKDSANHAQLKYDGHVKASVLCEIRSIFQIPSFSLLQFVKK